MSERPPASECPFKPDCPYCWAHHMADKPHYCPHCHNNNSTPPFVAYHKFAELEGELAASRDREQRLRAALEAIWACYADDDPEYVAAMKVATEDDGVAVMMPVPLVVLRQVRDALTDAEEQR